MDKSTMMMLGIVGVAGVAYLLYAKQSSGSPLSYLPQFGSGYNPYGVRPIAQQPNQTAALIAAGGSVAARLLPSFFDFTSGLVSRFSSPSQNSLVSPPGTGVLAEPQQWFGLDFLNQGYGQVGGGGYIEPTAWTSEQQGYADTVLW